VGSKTRAPCRDGTSFKKRPTRGLVRYAIVRSSPLALNFLPALSIGRGPSMRMKSNHRLGVTSVAAAVSGILCASAAGLAYAADQAAAPAAGTTAASGETLQEVVVTATATGVKKLDASYNIVSLSANDIAMTNPQAASDIYKLSPGVWPENSGGQ